MSLTLSITMFKVVNWVNPDIGIKLVNWSWLR